MTTLVFTICARNYVGLAKVLGQSVIRHGASVDFRIYVAEGPEDEATDDHAIVSAPEALRPYIPAAEFINMAFMYNVTEFCTALKAACFMHGFADGYDKCVYLDPDVFVMGGLEPVMRELDECAILVTPHLCIPSTYEGPRPDQGILATGIYNLGFLGLRRDTETDRFLTWWHQRLRSKAFNDHYNSLFTDQRWIDFVPSLFRSDAVRVWRHLGCNVAPWNFHERLVQQGRDGFEVRARASDDYGEEGFPLVFVHFSGFDFRRILEGTFDQLNLDDARTEPDLLPVYSRYCDAISEFATEMEHRLSLHYGFERFTDGTLVLPSHRRLFRVWRERHGDALDPFGTGPGTFHAALSERHLLGNSEVSDLAADKTTARSIANPDKLLRRARNVFRVLFCLVGRARFFLLIRSLSKLSRVEQHYDTFRLDDAFVQLSRANGRERL